MIFLSDSAKSRSFPLLVIGIILLNVYVFYLQLTSPNLDGFIERYGLVPASVDFTSWLTLFPFITSQFLHGGWLHIISNMLFLWVFGDNIEDSLGKVRFLLFYLVCGIIAGLTQYLFNPSSLIPMIGASGAVAGVLGAYWRLYPRSTVHALLPLGVFFTTVDIPASLMIGFWFVSQLFSGFATITDSAVTGDIGGVAFWAHVGGLVAGMALVTIFPPKYRQI